MPSNSTLQRQRTLGGMVGIVVLVCGLGYHFFPRLFHAEPVEVARRNVPAAPVAPGNTAAGNVLEDDQLNAGPPLTLAPTAVIAARLAHEHTKLPKQLTPDPPQLRALLERADKALAAGDLTGEPGSAATLFLQAAKDKPDSRRAAQGLIDVRSRLVAQIQRDIALGNAEDANDQLTALQQLPDSADDVAHLQAALKILTEVRPLLAKAAGLLQKGDADQPAGRSALDIYRQVQQIDPQNAVAEQGVLDVQHAVLDRALAAVAQDDFASADKVLAEAQAIRPGSQQVYDVRQRVNDMRATRAGGILDQARSALDGGNLVMAKQLAAQARATWPQLDDLAAFDQQLLSAQLYDSRKPGQVFSDRYVDVTGQSPAMVVIPTGSFLMGAAGDESDRNADEQPQHKVDIARGFAMSRSAITVGQFREFVRESGYVPDSVKRGGASVYDERSGAMHDDGSATWQDDYAGSKAADNLPVVNISWSDAKAYADWLSQRTGKTYRLPSEAEFAYALRGGTTTRYWWGDGTPKGKLENLTGSRDRSPSGRRWNNAFRDYGDGYWGPAPVMSFAPNPFGLYDMGGNVSEWTADCWHDNYIHAPVDGGAWLNPGCSVRVLRGGSWGSSPDQARSAWRQGTDGGLRSGRVGFRVVREL
ncbi:formylglycine-generating enzyme family protein [Rhodanobacter sp. DHG33]|uniref:formylglycine-generating enzyme family protein n=1 Tax=Rhodanobacter sp. DHG33 TaxID=2775921 RepID=UPI001780FB10|nr:formylglycine-generating enzyme family protein [Rhodanobacter sp. DHG33]MBD8898895.1 SUMF1/EgtB/PvdO family nonheme iron enzyme [Rhodanobacter sp. DHG33]